MFRLMGWTLAALCMYTVGVAGGRGLNSVENRRKDLPGVVFMACLAVWIWIALAKGVR